MATPPSASTFADILRREGLRVVEVGNWKAHNRNHKGPWGPVYGVMIHHTVTSGAARTVELCRTGHSTLPGPLCHGVITKDGTVHLVGYGRANHAGLGDDDVLRAVIAERSSLPVDNEANTDGNRHFYGFECENLGDGRDPWPAAQLDAIERAAAAICRHHGWKAESVIGHLEWQPGKVDPRGFSMNTMRDRVRDRLTHAPGWSRGEQNESEDDMPLYTSLGMTKEFRLDPGTWVSLAWDTEWADGPKQHAAGGQTFASGCLYNGALHLRVSGLTPGKEVQARLVEDDENGKTVKKLPIHEQPGTGGDTFLNAPLVGSVAANRRLKVQIVHYGEQPITVERAEVKLHSWKR